MECTSGTWRAIDYRGGGWIVEAIQSDHQIVVAMINAHDNAEANANRIVKAVNCHDDLVEALKGIIRGAHWYTEIGEKEMAVAKQTLAKVKAL